MDQNDEWPFHQWLDLSVRVLGLSPQIFWSMSLYDWLNIMRMTMERQTSPPLNRDKLMGMMTQFPDYEE